MVQRLLEAQGWIDQWESVVRAQGGTPDDIASLLFVVAGLLRHDEGKWLLDLCVDANRKLGCSAKDLSFVLGNSAQRIAMLEMGKAP